MTKQFKNLKPWKKGQSGNPKGRPPCLGPDFQKMLEQNKVGLKALIIQYLNLTESQIGERQLDPQIPLIEKLLGQCFERIANDGDVQKLKMLLEIAFGKLPDEREPPEFAEFSKREKEIIEEYRKDPDVYDRPLKHLTDEELDAL